MNADENTEHPSIKSLVHLGLVAAAIDGLKLVERIDERLPLDMSKGVEVTHGQRVKAMVINGLGYTNNPLYMTTQFFKDKDVARLIGPGVESSHLNDYGLARTLDALFEYGTTRLFAEIAFDIAQERGLLGNSLHIDTSTILLHGEYEQEAVEGEPTPDYGHSKAHRRDLKQVVLSLTVTGKAAFPLWFEGLPGNSSDKTNFHDSIAKVESFKSAVKMSDDFLWVADSALYNAGKLDNAAINWLTLVPKTVGKVQDLIQQVDEKVQWTALENGYKVKVYTDHKPGQVWALFHSAQAYTKERATFDEKIKKALGNANKSLASMSKTKYGCKEDALKAAQKYSDDLKYHSAVFTIKTIERYSKPGKPAKGSKPDIIEYQLCGQLDEDEAKQAPLLRKLGRFVLATNDIDNTGLDAQKMLSTYKEQQGVERGFRFLKADEFQLDHIYLKTPSRIDALMMVMTLTLMVYNTSEYEMRQTMEKKGITLPNQKNKETKTPTLRWVFQMMQGIHTFSMPGMVECVAGKDEVREKIIRLFGPIACAIYDVKD